MNTTKQHILAEIVRLAKTTDGKSPGVRAFERQTGIRESDWFPHLWLRWSDAVQEAGLTRNAFTKAWSDDYLLENYARLAQRLGRLPIQGELILESKANASFPSEKTFRRFEGKSKLLSAVVAFCRTHAGFDDVLAMCEGAVAGPGQERGSAGSCETHRDKRICLLNEVWPSLQDWPNRFARPPRVGTAYSDPRTTSYGSQNRNR